MNKQVVWDPLVRLLHWGLVVCFFVALLDHQPSDPVHRSCGYLILLILGVRFIWGFIGSYHARYRNFVYNIDETMQYLLDLSQGSQKFYPGHNPLGALMVVATNFGLFLLCLSGLLTDLSTAPKWSRAWGQFHDISSSLLLLMVEVHILAVLAMSYLSGEFLPWSMITGCKRAPGKASESLDRSSRDDDA